MQVKKTTPISYRPKKAKTSLLEENNQDIVVNGEAIDHIESLLSHNKTRKSSNDTIKSRTTTPNLDPF